MWDVGCGMSVGRGWERAKWKGWEDEGVRGRMIWNRGIGDDRCYVQKPDVQPRQKEKLIQTYLRMLCTPESVAAGAAIVRAEIPFGLERREEV